jgi:TonB family protein
MKPTTGSVRPRRIAAPKPRKKVRLDLKRRPEPEPGPEIITEKKSKFGRVVLLVALLHLLVIAIACYIYQLTPAPKPPEQFISLLPEGSVVKGTAGPQQAHKLGPTTSAPTVHHHTSSSTPPPKPAAVTPPKPKLIVPPPTIEPPSQLTPATLDKPKPAPPKPTPPKPTPPKPKIKVDLTLADAPDQPVDKPKHQPKKPAKPTHDTDDDSADNPDSAGLSKEQIAAQLGEKLDAAGVKNAAATGKSGAPNAHPNNFSDFYASIRDQVMSQWQSPNLSDETAINPVVQIHVENDGRVPASSVHLIQSSGNAIYDDSAVAAARNLGYLHEPLPQGCPPDIPITFKLTR